MQEYGGGTSNKSGDFREGADSRERGQESFHSQHQYGTQKNYGCPNRDTSDQNITTYSRVATGIYEATSHQYQNQNTRYNKPSAPTFSSPPNSPLVGLLFDPSSPNYSGPTSMAERINADRRSSWSISNQEPIGTGAKKKIVKSHDKRNAYSADNRYQDRYKDTRTETDHRHRNKERNLTSESTSSLDFFTEGERMVSELCNIPDSSTRHDINHKSNQKGTNIDDDKNKDSVSSEVLLTALDKIIIHDQIPTQIVQLAIEACTDAENIAIAHHNRPCFKNIHSICAKTRSNVQKPDSAVANLHSQGIPWVIKNFIFSFVRILDGWKGVKELLSEKHDTFSRIENKYYSQNIRECFVQWQAVTKEMLTHIYKTFKCLDHGFTMEQKSFTHNYYATNSAAPRHQNQSKFQPPKSHVSTPRPINASPQPYNVIQPPWIQNQPQSVPQNYNDSPWAARSSVAYKKIPVVSPNSQNFYPLNEHNEAESYQKSPYKCEPCIIRETKPRQSWTITNVPDFRTLESVYHAEQRDLYTQLKHKMDAELGKAPGQSALVNMPCDLLQRRDMELKAKMIPLSHVEKTLIPSMASTADIRSYVQKNNSCGDTKEEADFFAAWGQMVQKETNDFLTHHTHNIQIPTNVVTIANNISGPVQFLDLENDEFHEMSKVYMKPGSYKVPIKPAEPVSSLMPNPSQDVVYDSLTENTSSLKVKVPFSQVTLAPQPKYNIESWPCLMSRRAEEIFINNQKPLARPSVPCLDMRGIESLEILNSMTSDRAWEAAKQSAPKLMDFIYDGSKSDTARLYDALGLTANEDFSDELKQPKNMEHGDAWSAILQSSQFMSKQSPTMWDQTSNTQECVLNSSQNSVPFSDSIAKNKPEEQQKSLESDDHVDIEVNKNEDLKRNARCPNFDQTGNYIKDDNQKRLSVKAKVAVSGTWYHPKKKKPLSGNTVKKFESVILHLSHINEAAFIEQDMDIKVAPRFYEVVKYPMCLNDISTKLKNSSYTEYDQVVQDFRRIFNNVRLYLKTYPDSVMKKNVNKVSAEFEKFLCEEFQNKCDLKNKSYDSNKKPEKGNDLLKTEVQKDEIKKDPLSCRDDHHEDDK